MLSWSSAPVTFQNWNNAFYRKEFSVEYNIYHVGDTQRVTSRDAESFVNSAVTATTCHGNETCYTIESNSNLKIVKNNFISTLQPFLDKSHRCSILLMSNLANVFWISVNCTEEMLSNVVCFRNNDTASLPNASDEHHIEFCAKNEIYMKGNCYIFASNSPKQQAEFWKCCHEAPNLNQKEASDILLVISQATNLDLSFIIHRPQNSHKVTELLSRKIWMSTTVEKVENIASKQGWIGYRTVRRKKLVFGHSIFCCNTTYISQASICDNFNDCGSLAAIARWDDEHACQCEQQEGYCRNICTKSSCSCSPLYFQTRHGKCMGYMFSSKPGEKPIRVSQQYTCQDGSLIPQAFMNDLVSDCGFLGDDEAMYKQLLANHTECDLCVGHGQLSCDKFSIKCYKFSDICLYQLNEHNHIVPCRTGSHMQECRLFECNFQYKCPRIYCVPWKYICDGKWDCPFGTDEKSICKTSRLCKTLFKCKKSIICVHMQDVCNTVKDCPFEDDELLCDLHDVVCLHNCTCLNYAIQCNNATNIFSSHRKLPYISYHITFAKIISLSKFMQIKNTVYLNFSNNFITDMCGPLFHARTLVLFDIRFNSLTTLSSFCFDSLPFLRYVNIKYNHLTDTHPRSFCNLSFPLSVDLSHNHLTSVPKNLFFHVRKFVALNLIANPLTQLESGVFVDISVDYLRTDKHEICCVEAPQSKCSAAKTWNSTCSQLLTSLSVVVTAIISSCIILVFNCIALTINIIKLYSHYSLSVLRRERESKASPFNIIMSFSHFGDLLCGIYLDILWTHNMKFGASYPLWTDHWMSSAACSVAFSVSLFFFLNQPILTAVMNLSRFRVVKNPINTKFKSAKFVIAFLTTIMTSGCVIGVGSGTSLGIRQRIKTSLCLSFVDPSDSVWEVRVLTLSLAVLQLSSILCCSVMHFLTIDAMWKSQRDTGQNRSINLSTVMQLILLSLSIIICWVPSSTMFLSALFLEQYPCEMLLWTTVSVMPIHAITNPLIAFLFMS